DVAIIGAGLGGLLTAARLRELGVQSVRLIDKGADVGGTWYWNRYPGIACDVESYVYMPLLEELGYIPTEKYTKGDEIFAHCRRIAEHYDLYRDARLQTEVNEIHWDPALSRWIISTDHGDSMRARFVAMANGYLQKPKLPGIEGITAFEGHAFHTNDGITTTPDPTWPNCRTSESQSSALAPPPYSAYRTWRDRPNTCWSSSAHRLPSMCAAIDRPIQRGRRIWRTAGSAAGSRTSNCSRRVGRPRRIWSTMLGRASSRNSS